MSEMEAEKLREFPKENDMTNGAKTYNETFDLLHEIGGDIRPIKTAIWRVYRLLSAQVPVSFSRVKDLWYGDARAVVRADEMDALRRVAAKVRAQKEEARRALKRVADAYLGAAEQLRQIDEDFYRAEVHRLERQAHNLGILDRAGAAPVGNGPSPKGEAAE